MLIANPRSFDCSVHPKLLNISLSLANSTGVTPLARSAGRVGPAFTVAYESPNTLVVIRCTLRATRAHVRWLFSPLNSARASSKNLTEQNLVAAAVSLFVTAEYNVSALRENAGSYTCALVGGGLFVAEILFHCILSFIVFFRSYKIVDFTIFLPVASPIGGGGQGGGWPYNKNF